MTPLRVTWHLSSPIATSGYPIHLDDLVAYCQTAVALRMMGDAPATGNVRDLARELPLAREERDGDWVWKASALVPVPGLGTTSHAMRFWTRKTDPFDYAERFDRGHLNLRTKPGALKPFGLMIDTQRGLLKNGYKFYATKFVHALQGWCVGDEDALRELLDPNQGSPLMWIGARGRSGLGRIAKVEIVADEAAAELWSRRTLPWPYEGAHELELATRPPYWEASNRRRAWVHPDLVI